VTARAGGPPRRWRPERRAEEGPKERPAQRLSLLLPWAKYQSRDQVPACLEKALARKSASQRLKVAGEWTRFAALLTCWADVVEEGASRGSATASRRTADASGSPGPDA
jgi:hypothetical protein